MKTKMNITFTKMKLLKNTRDSYRLQPRARLKKFKAFSINSILIIMIHGLMRIPNSKADGVHGVSKLSQLNHISRESNMKRNKIIQ